MDQRDECKAVPARERELVIAYLSYALEDVRALSKIATDFLQMTIASLSEDVHPEDSGTTAEPALRH